MYAQIGPHNVRSSAGAAAAAVTNSHFVSVHVYNGVMRRRLRFQVAHSRQALSKESKTYGIVMFMTKYCTYNLGK